MDLEKEKIGIGLICDEIGRIQRVFHNTLVEFVSDGVGLDFAQIVEPGSAEKAQNMLNEARRSGAAFDWDLAFWVDGKMISVHFTASAFDDQIVVVGALSRSEMVSFYEEVMLINNEQINLLRSLRKAQAQESVPQEPNNTMFEELTELNNELAGMQRELAKKNAELAQLNTQKNHFLGMAAHDLRNPLGIIKSYSELLLSEIDLVGNEKYQKFLNIIHSSSHFMLGLVDDLLNVSKIESGKLDLNLQSADLINTLEQNIELNRVFAERKNIALKAVTETQALPVMIDVPKVEQVLNNLLSNAVKYSHPETTVTIQVRCKDAEVIVAVADEGQGIPKDELDQLFQPFQKTSVQSTDGELSTGLGLMIVRRIIEGHGGRIWVESEVGVGSTFLFSLPLVEPEAGTPEVSKAPQ